MAKFIVTLVSDWDSDRFHVESQIADSELQAHTILNMFKSKCEKSFEEDEQYTIEETDNSYLAYYGTKENPDTSVGWEKCIIQNIK